MINYWWVTRPNRKLNSVPDVLATFSEISLNQEWQGERGTHLSLEKALEDAGLKRIGERRDATGGGARTYQAWIASLGLIFIQESTKQIKLTLAGEALINGDSPVAVLKSQVLKYQFPSSFSLSRSVDVSARFRIRPFKFLLKLLSDPEIGHLTEEEIAKVVIIDAENETDKCYKQVVAKLKEFRASGDACLEKDFFTKYKSTKSEVNLAHPYSHLTDTANTFINWLEYTQLIFRENGIIEILSEKRGEVAQILAEDAPFIDRPESHEYFQRKYGLDPNHKKDTRNLTLTSTVTAKTIAEAQIRKAYIAISLSRPITKITGGLIDEIIAATGLEAKFVEDSLNKLYPHGSVSAFMSEYFNMAFKGRDEATDFEKATVEIFSDVFGFETKHVGPIGLTPDVLVLSHSSGYQGIIDNKAYSRYTISNDHKNRMVHNYIKGYSSGELPLAFFSYIAGGFGTHINSQIKEIVTETSVNGSAIGVSDFIGMIEKHGQRPYSHDDIRSLFSLNRQILLADI
jgi:hypothetical protein